MRRRDFIEVLASAGLFMAATNLLGDSIIVSSNPLIAEFDLQSLFSRYTPADDFYVRNHFEMPQVGMVKSLTIAGEVEKPRRLLLEDLARLKEMKLGAVLECAGNGMGPQALASNGKWAGWPLRDVVALARPKPGAKFLHLIGGDGFTRSVTVEQGRQDAMLVTKLNDKPLAQEHGAPWRALFPGWYGMESVKWLKHIEVTDKPLPQESNDYLAEIKEPSGTMRYRTLPRIRVKSVLTYPALGAVLRPGRVTLRGLAWSGEGKIVAVEISTNGGRSWSLANLHSTERYEWVVWNYSVNIRGTGVIEFSCRAVDDKGSAQPAERDPQRIDGYGENTIEKVQFFVQSG